MAKKVIPKYGSTTECSYEGKSRGTFKPRYGRKINGLQIGTMVVACLVGCSIVFFTVFGVIGGSKAFDTNAAPVKTYVNGTDVGTMTEDELVEVINGKLDEIKKDYTVAVDVNGETMILDAADLGIEYDARALAEKIIAERKECSAADKVRLSISYGLGSERGFAKNEYSLDVEPVKEVIRAKVIEICERYYKAPVNAEAVFDPVKVEFSYTKETLGVRLDAEELADRIYASANGDKSEVTAVLYDVKPEITESELKKNTVIIGECTTQASGSVDRLTNIRLMCEAVNGLCIKPGDTLSINDLVGERTPEKGFKKAPAIVDGKNLTDQYGGGICQLAGTLYNAALQADMEIVERVKHSFPSNYLPIGLDATLNWDDKDLKIKNRSD